MKKINSKTTNHQFTEKISTMKKTTNTIRQLTETAPIFILITMILSFVLMMMVQVFYYAVHVLGHNIGIPAIAWVMALGIALMFQMARFAFGLTGAKEFGEGQTGKGLTGILFSLSLSIFESFEVVEIANVWANGNSSLFNSSIMLLEAFIWLGFFLEIRLAINLSGSIDYTPFSTVATSSNRPEPTKTELLKDNQTFEIDDSEMLPVPPVSTFENENGSKIPLLRMALKNAKSNLSAWKAKATKGEGTIETNEKNISKWEQKINNIELELLRIEAVAID